MSSEARRRERLEELTKFALEKVDWLMSQFEFVLDDTGQFKGELAWTWTGWHTDPSDFLKQEAQKRWGCATRRHETTQEWHSKLWSLR